VTAKCDVTSWDDQVALFALGHSTFGSIDIVLPNAGINEIGLMVDVSPPDDGPDRPTPPDLTTLNVDLIGVLYTTRLALYYFDRDDRAYPGLRAICFTASMSTFYGANYGVMYGASKA
jgi:NAD(P)-dependent dehydrogenase (short-subunit alcohol dehydrogenase family)